MAVDNMINRSGADALIPKPVIRDIIKTLPQKSAALSLMKHVTMSSKTTTQPVQTSVAEAYWVNGDTGLKQTTALNWGTKQMHAEEMAVVVPIPEAVLDDADYDIWAEVKPSLIEAFGRRLDKAVLFGIDKPASWTDPAIVPGAVAADNAVAMGSIADADIVSHVNEVMALVEDKDFEVTGFAARKRIRSLLRDLRDENRNPIFNQSLQADGTQAASIYGEPVAYVQNAAWDASAAELIAGDWNMSILGIRQDITFKIFTEGVITDETGKVILNLMQQDSVALRAVMRVGYAVHSPISADNVGLTPAQRFPFAVLTPEAGG